MGFARLTWVLLPLLPPLGSASTTVLITETKDYDPTVIARSDKIYVNITSGTTSVCPALVSRLTGEIGDRRMEDRRQPDLILSISASVNSSGHARHSSIPGKSAQVFVIGICPVRQDLSINPFVRCAWKFFELSQPVCDKSSVVDFLFQRIKSVEITSETDPQFTSKPTVKVDID